MIDWEKLFEEKGFDDYWPLNGRRSKRCRSGWLQLQCPCCCSSGDLAGIHKEGSIPVCYFCGKHSPVEFVKELFNMPWYEAKNLCKKHGVSILEEYEYKKKQDDKPKIDRNKTLSLPVNTNIKRSGGEYLKSRGFDVKRLISEFGIVQGKKHSANADRIIFPIYYDGTLVSYIGRSFRKDAKNKYKKCSDAEELIPHKKIIVGLEDSRYDFIVVVEGVFDLMAWPKGMAVATLGAKWSQAQLNMLRKTGKRIYILFDDERQAQELGKKLANGLAIHGLEAYNLMLTDGRDSADLTTEEKDELIEVFENG